MTISRAVQTEGNVMIKLLQSVVNRYYALVYPPDQIDPVHRQWMAMRRHYGIKARVRDW